MPKQKQRKPKGGGGGAPLWQKCAGGVGAVAVLCSGFRALTSPTSATPAEGWLGSSDAAFAAKYLATPCDIDRYGEGELSPARFAAEYQDKKPVVFRAGADVSAALRASVSRAELDRVYGDVPTAIMGRGLNDGEPDIVEEMPLRSFLAALAADRATPKYLFDSQTFLQEASRRVGRTPLDALDVPAHFHGFRTGGRAFFSVGGDKTGVPMHFHSAAYNLVLAGAKHWTLYGHDAAQHGHASRAGNVTFDPREHHLRWLEEALPALPPQQRPLQCVQGVGDIAYIPAGWYHGTLNVGETVSVAQQDGGDAGIQRLYRAVKTGGPGRDGQPRDTVADVAALTAVAARADVPINNEVQNHLATRLFEEGRLEEARSWFGAAIASNPRLGVAYKNMGVVLRAMGRADEVLGVAKAAVAARTGHKQLKAVVMDAAGAMTAKGDKEGAAAAKAFADTLGTQ